MDCTDIIIIHNLRNTPYGDCLSIHETLVFFGNWSIYLFWSVNSVEQKGVPYPKTGTMAMVYKYNRECGFCYRLL